MFKVNYVKYFYTLDSVSYINSKLKIFTIKIRTYFLFIYLVKNVVFIPGCHVLKVCVLISKVYFYEFFSLWAVSIIFHSDC